MDNEEVKVDPVARGDVLKDEVVVDPAAAKAAEDAAAAEAAKGADATIPKARFDEAVKKERDKAAAADARARDLQAKLEKQTQSEDAEKVAKEIDALEDALDKAIADGDDAKKKELRAQIRAKTQDLGRAEAKQQAAYATAMAVEQVNYNAAVTALEAAHPEMNPDAPEYNEELAGQMVELKAAYELTGMGSTEALKKAQKLIFPAGAKKDEPKKPEPTAEEKQKAAEAAAKLKEDAVKRGLEAKGKQPPGSADALGKPSDVKGHADAGNVSRMSDEDFGKLTDAEKSRLRGDSL